MSEESETGVEAVSPNFVQFDHLPSTNISGTPASATYICSVTLLVRPEVVRHEIITSNASRTSIVTEVTALTATPVNGSELFQNVLAITIPYQAKSMAVMRMFWVRGVIEFPDTFDATRETSPAVVLENA